ncbi:MULTISPECIES: alkaline phosphatase family protein [Actinotignum]|uniref:Alkaline phosphatase family protein n=1 Tax=Actinotignum timonense TaxID=1870995 RepID=A0AAW9HB75_9ACTO|nr:MULTISPECIES: alkaline phosphatase family protein [Actinotignum]MBS5747998.1 alkaline phosphatase family protein [Actinotignum schaalii]MDE1535589.1 alkaline phosphatase family protein [Actinotignum schaalii]MDE1558050.1 alkaline phosphatase family protein [Actinotignum schaalii]MDE1663573.1 alkaline phosphatase family protein [Actinotignum schaalii]MDK6373910.1 alkaline phosphatase family protein [Actinotignum timonense]
MTELPVLPAARSLRAVLGECLAACGVLPEMESAAAETERAGVLDLPRASRVCLVLVDGLGAENLAARIGHAPTLRALTAREPLTSTAPSTTAAALTTLGTGELPGRTAMLSYSLRSPRTGRNFSLISWEDSGLNPEEWQPFPTWAQRLEAARPGIAKQLGAIQDPDHIGSGLTRAAWRGFTAIGGPALDDRVHLAARFLREGGRFAYLYWGEVDHRGHRWGATSEEWTMALEDLDAGIRLLTRLLPPDTLLVLTADHGMVDPSERIDVATTPALSEGVDLYSGEERAVHLYTREPEAVAARWRDYLGERSWIYTKKEAIATGMFGPVTAQAREAMGDVLAFQRGPLSVVHTGQMQPGATFMRGVHGSLTPTEMLIPLLLELT